MKKIIIHPEYDSETRENDIAVLKLRKFLSFSFLIILSGGNGLPLEEYPPVCLPIQGQSWTTGEDATVVGKFIKKNQHFSCLIDVL